MFYRPEIFLFVQGIISLGQIENSGKRSLTVLGHLHFANRRFFFSCLRPEGNKLFCKSAIKKEGGGSIFFKDPISTDNSFPF